MTPEQEAAALWDKRYQALIDNSVILSENPELLQKALSSVNVSLAPIKANDRATVKEFPARLATLLSLYGDNNEAAYNLNNTAWLMARNYAVKSEISDIVIDHAAKRIDFKNQGKNKLAFHYLQTGLKTRQSENLPENAIRPLAIALTIDALQSQEDFFLNNKIFINTEADKNKIADQALALADTVVSIGKPGREDDQLALRVYSSALKLGSSDNKTAAMRVFGNILLSRPYDIDVADRNLTFVEQARQQGWLDDTQITTGLDGQITDLTTVLKVNAAPYADSTTAQQWNVRKSVTTANASLTYAMTLQPDIWQNHVDFLESNMGLNYDFSGRYYLTNRLNDFKDGRTPKTMYGYGTPYWGIERSPDEIQKIRQGASDLMSYMALEMPAALKHYSRLELIENAIELNPENQKALNFLQTDATSPDSESTKLVVKLMENARLTEAVGQTILAHQGLTNVFDEFRTRQDSENQKQKKFQNIMSAFD